MKTICMKISGVNIGTSDLGSITSIYYHDIEFRKCVLLLRSQIGGGYFYTPAVAMKREQFRNIAIRYPSIIIQLSPT
jgi:hypothetical protein